ncbi:MAG: hypothetical protein ABIG39_04385 [Candidatus Micrarchaeota archaeon]
MKCVQCGKKGNFRISAAGTVLCKEHFIHYVEKRITHGARETGVFKGKRIGVAVSGGAKSSAALFVLQKIALKRRCGLIALTVGESGESEKLCSELRVKHIGVEARGNEGVMKALGRGAKKQGLDSLVTGHCLEDFVQEMLSYCMLKKPEEMVRVTPDRFWGNRLNLRHPAPLFRLYETEVFEYAKFVGLPGARRKNREGLEKGLSEFMERVEKKHPGSKHKMLKSLLFLKA